MKYTKPKTVNIDQDEIIELHAIEHDTKTRFINFKFVGSNTVLDLTGCKVRIYGKNSRYIEIFNDLTVLDAKRGLAQLELTDKMIRPGITEYQLKIMPIGGGQLSSNTMRIKVDNDLMRDSSVESSNEYKAFENALKTIDQYDIRLRNVESEWKDGNVKSKDSIIFLKSVLKAAETLIYNGNKVYDTAHKPTPGEIGAVANTGGTIKGRLEIGTDEKYANIGVGSDDVAIQNTKSGKWLQLKDNGRLCYDNRNIQLEPQQTPLWEGGSYMTEGQNITLSKSITDCVNGIILVWGDWDAPSTPTYCNYTTFVIPKNAGINNSSNFLCSIPLNENSGWIIKSVMIKNNVIKGNSNSTQDGWNDVVLYKVIEY